MVSGLSGLCSSAVNNTKTVETLAAKILKYKLASKFEDFRKTGFKFRIAPLADE